MSASEWMASVGTRMHIDELEALDAYRRRQRNPESRSRAIRNILREALREYLRQDSGGDAR